MNGKIDSIYHSLAFFVYKTKVKFIKDIKDGFIVDQIEERFKKHNINHSNEVERRSWIYSLMFMRNVIDDEEIANDSPLAIEYQIPLISKRVDFLITGKE